MSLATLVAARGAPLLDALEVHNPGAREHADGTASYAFASAVELGLDRERAEAVRETARLHDVGQVYVPAALLARGSAQLTPGERAVLEAHPANGAELARGTGIPEEACDWIAATAERFDGSGLARLGAERIPLEARIVVAACTCDAALAAGGADAAVDPPQVAIGRLREAAGRELDPRVAEALSAVLERVVS